MALVAATIAAAALGLAVATRRYEKRLQDASGDLSLKALPPPPPPRRKEAQEAPDRQQATHRETPGARACWSGALSAWLATKLSTLVILTSSRAKERSEA